MRALLILAIIFAFASAQVCYGVPRNESSVCNGNGICVSDNNCVCNVGFTGTTCNNTCGWQNSFGAPTPIVSVQASGINVTITVTLARRQNVRHFISFNDVSSCSLASSFSTYMNWPLLSQTNCTQTYGITQSLSSLLLNMNTTIISSGADVFDITGDVHMFYVDLQDGCSLTAFKTPIVVKTFIQGTSFTAFDSNNQVVGTIRQNRIFLDASNFLNIQTTITLSTFGTLTNFTFESSTSGINLIIPSNSVLNPPCGTEGGVNCNYTVNFRSASTATDYSGRYVIRAELVRSHNVSVTVRFSFMLTYAIPIPPPAVNVTLTTATSLFSSFFAQRKNVFSNFEAIWVMNEITQGFTLGNRKLTVRNAYLCCMTNRQAMPAQGCAVQTGDMAVWAQLIANESPFSTAPWAVSSQNIPQLFRNGFSFSAIGIGQADRLCYLQVESFLKSQLRSALQLDNTVYVAYESLSFTYSNPNPAPQGPEIPVIPPAKKNSSFKVVGSLLMVLIVQLFCILF